jgi:hypothetical protein
MNDEQVRAWLLMLGFEPYDMQFQAYKWKLHTSTSPRDYNRSYIHVTYWEKSPKRYRISRVGSNKSYAADKGDAVVRTIKKLLEPTEEYRRETY